MDETKIIVCPNCGAENRRSLIVTTCLRCGQSLQDPGEAAAAPSPPPAEPAEEPSAATAFTGPLAAEVPPPPVPALPPLLPPVEQAPPAELPPVAQTVPYRGEPTPPDGEPLFGSSESGMPGTQVLRQITLVACLVALAVMLGRALRTPYSPPTPPPSPWFPHMPSQGGPFPPGMATMPKVGPIMPDEIRDALGQPLIVAPETPLPGRGRTVVCALGGGRLQLSGLRYGILPQFPAGLRRFLPHPPHGQVVQLEMTARAVPPGGVRFTPTNLRLEDDRGAWSAPVHVAWTGAPQATVLAPGVTLGISVYFAVGAGRSPAALGVSETGPEHPAGSPVVLTRFTAADRVPPSNAKPKRLR